MRSDRGARPVVRVVFYRTPAGNEPVREWLWGLSAEDRREVGLDLARVECAWPLGMPLVRKLEAGLWEVRSRLSHGTARVVFSVDGPQIVLLHGFVKKSKKTPLADIRVARHRLADSKEGSGC